MLKKHVQRFEDELYAVFRILVGLLFFQHGAQKLLGWFGGTAQPLASFMGFIGAVEFFGGLAIAVGLWTRLAALGSAIIMVGAYVTVHASQGLMPVVNGGELALLYLAAFLVVLADGGRKWSLELAWKKKEFF